MSFFLGWVERFKNWNQRWNGAVPVSYHKCEGFEEKERIRKCYIRLWWRYALHYILIPLIKICVFCLHSLVYSPDWWEWLENSHVKMSVKRDRYFGRGCCFILTAERYHLKRTESVFLIISISSAFKIPWLLKLKKIIRKTPRETEIRVYTCSIPNIFSWEPSYWMIFPENFKLPWRVCFQKSSFWNRTTTLSNVTFGWGKWQRFKIRYLKIRA